ncbi:uroporphyrinogen-III synthase [Algibacillus agarilyticus]|uniref:uroporphyrinogen-III synthase n=1 Tax=Algibacillus agarilyticus TaxID=2234133 RepID=UPI000DD0C97C|nr:uroporphyrinogen-III synthase [Algibacillus agarilyticus]
MVNSLSTIRVLNPRFSQSGVALTQSLLAAGFTPCSIPLFSIQSGNDLNAFQRANLTHCSLIFTSQYAIEFGLNQLDTKTLNTIKPQTVYAIGQATAHSLRQKGFTDIVVNAGHTSESFLGSTSLKTSDNVVIIKGEQGRNTLAIELAKLGFSVDNYAVYKRCWTLLSYADLTRICQLNAWFITSGEMLEHLMRQCDKNQLTPQHDLLIFVPSERVAQIAKSFAFTQVIDVKSASNSDMIKALQRYYQNNNFKVDK